MSNCSASFSLLLSHSWSVFRFLSNQRLAQAREGPCLHSAVAGSGTGVCQAKKSLKKKKRTSPIVQTSQGPINIQVAIRPTRGSDVAAFIDHEPKRAGTKKENPTKPATRGHKATAKSDDRDFRRLQQGKTAGRQARPTHLGTTKTPGDPIGRTTMFRRLPPTTLENRERCRSTGHSAAGRPQIGRRLAAECR